MVFIPPHAFICSLCTPCICISFAALTTYLLIKLIFFFFFFSSLCPICILGSNLLPAKNRFSQCKKKILQRASDC